ncbi:MAG: tetrathionate reductase family octaheme c-type cytochrome [Chloroflexi bacterium]|nr:tetrathionate reductase family octaheme c-type cytochrome [Chloroflexota bacterium]
MKDFKYIWVIGLTATALIVVVPIILFVSASETPTNDPWQYVPERLPDVSHAALMNEPFATGQDVTRACLDCHPSAAQEMAGTAHFTWLSDPVPLEGKTELVQVGKVNLLNNFCIGIQSNWTGCTRCHAGYGWSDANFDFTDTNNVDCLVCHDQSGGYAKAASGLPAEGVDLLAAARSVGTPTRENCGYCHFNGGGGNAVKHGDLDESLYFPAEEQDVHMGRYDFQCVDCHKTENHEISGRAISVSVDNANQVYCTDCHTGTVHEDSRLNAHTDSVACQTCHIPSGATREATKMVWDWSTAGDPTREESPHEYLKIKGSFVYEDNIMPTYAWFNGTVDRYLLGDPLDPDGVTTLNPLNGDISDPNAKIWPFKVHVARQPYDTLYNYLLQPQTVGETGYWTTFDWNSALENGSRVTGLPYSGQYGFAETEMNWTLSHMVVPKENALQCTDCHGESGRLDWLALGYNGDPITWGGREEQE